MDGHPGAPRAGLGARGLYAIGQRSGSSALELALGLQMPINRVLFKLLLWCGVGSALAGLAIFLRCPSDSWENLAGAVAVDLGGTVLLLLWLGRTTTGGLVVNPLTGLLGLYALRRLLGLIYVVGQTSSLMSPFGIVPTGSYIEASVKAEWVTLAGTVAFCVGWGLARRRQSGAGNFTPLTRWHDRRLWVAYAFGLAGFLGNWLSSGALSELGNLVTITSGLAYGALFALLAFSKEYGVKGRLRGLTYVALLPLMANVLTHGMKSAFFFALLPVGAAYLLRKPKMGLALSVLGVLLLLVFIYPYVEMYRAANWGDARGASVGEVVQVVRQNFEQEGTGLIIESSWELFKLRFGSVNEAGAVVYLADQEGFMGGFFIKNLMYGFIPRVLWPGKPSWDPAGWFTSYLGGIPETEGMSSTALHIGPELYWMYGWPTTMLGLLVLGLYYRKINDWLLKAGRANPVFLAAWYPFLAFVTFIEEVRFNAAILSPLILMGNAFIIHCGVQVILQKQLGEYRKEPLPATVGTGYPPVDLGATQ